MKQGIDLWVTETNHESLKLSYKVKETLYSKESDFQKIDVVDTELLGRVLFNDGLLMTSERDEFIYHEMISHVAMSVHPDPKNILIIGGGDGGTAREVLKYPSVEKVTMVEIDPCVVEACGEHLKSISNGFENPKLEVIINDGVKFVKETSETFDLVLVDSTDPIGPAAPLFGDEFYEDIYNCLSEKGIVVSQCETAFLESEMQAKLLEVLNKRFPVLKLYNYSNITYPGGLWSFSFASKGLDPILDMNPVNQDFMKDLKYYNHQIHKASFVLPEFQRQQVQKFLK